MLVTTPVTDNPDVDRVVVPGAASAAGVDPRLADWADDRSVTVEPLRSAAGEVGFDAALEDVATHSNTASALTVAKVIDYPVAHLDLTGSRRQWRLHSLLLLSMVLATGVGLLPHAVTHAIRRRRAELSGV